MRIEGFGVEVLAESLERIVNSYHPVSVCPRRGGEMDFSLPMRPAKNGTLTVFAYCLSLIVARTIFALRH